MGRSTARVLVGLLFVLGIVGAGTYRAHHQASTQASSTVNPQSYSEFWWWPGVTIPAGLQINRLYVLAQAFNRQEQFEPYWPSPPRLKKTGEVILVYRLEKPVAADILAAHAQLDIAAWELAGNRVRGIQIDFDSGTSALENYATFLARLRTALDKRFVLSVTGLMDWGNARQYDMQAMSATVDEIVFQTYQGTTTLPGYEKYLEKIIPLRIPFKVGVISGGEFSSDASNRLSRESDFRGFVVFLR